MFPTKLGKLDLGSRIYLLYMKDNISFAYQIALTSKLVLENKQIPMFFELQAVLSLVEKNVFTCQLHLNLYLAIMRKCMY